MIRILFVCSGNICRSPALEAILKEMVEKKGLSNQIFIDSCGIHSWFLDSKADPMMSEAAASRGISIDSRAKLFSQENFKTFDYIFVVDNRLLEMLKSSAQTKKIRQKMHLATEFSTRFSGEEIPDPYGRSKEDFDLTMMMAEDCCKGILAHLEKAL